MLLDTLYIAYDLLIYSLLHAPGHFILRMILSIYSLLPQDNILDISDVKYANKRVKRAHDNTQTHVRIPGIRK